MVSLVSLLSTRRKRLGSTHGKEVVAPRVLRVAAQTGGLYPKVMVNIYGN